MLILIFEILDVKNDDPHLQTVPQQIGVQRTKMIGSGLLLVFLLLEIFVTHLCAKSLLLKVCIAGSTLLFLLFSNEKRSKYYSSFWVESIPVLWLLLLLCLK